MKRRGSGASSCLLTPTALGAQVLPVIPGHGRAAKVQNDIVFRMAYFYWNGCLQQLNRHCSVSGTFSNSGCIACPCGLLHVDQTYQRSFLRSQRRSENCCHYMCRKCSFIFTLGISTARPDESPVDVSVAEVLLHSLHWRRKHSLDQGRRSI